MSAAANPPVAAAHGSGQASIPEAARAPGRSGVLSIRWVVSTAAVVLMATALLGMGALSERNARSALGREIEARLMLQARNLAASSSSALLGDFPELTLVPLIKDLRGQQPDLALAVVVDHRNVVQGHADPRALGAPFRAPDGLAPGDIEPLSRSEYLRSAGPLLVVRAPVLHGTGQVIGAAYVGLSKRSIDAKVQASRRQQALLLACLTALSAAAAFLLISHLLRPVGVLRAGLERIGRGDLDTPIPVNDRTELGLLAGTVNEMTTALKRAQAGMLERERLTHELGLASEIQRSLLPPQAVTAGAFEIRGEQRAAAEVGGDYWDVLTLPQGRVGIAVADVSGKGLAGCMVMSMLSALLRALRTSHASPTELLTALDEQLAESLRPGVFVTMWYGVLDSVSGRLTFASAGHNPLLVWRQRTGEVEVRSSRGIPIGAIRGGAIRATLRDETIQLEPGDVCVQFTDGYTEAFQAGTRELFGLERVRQAVRDHAAMGGEAVLRALDASVAAWSGGGMPDDDETLLVMTCDPEASGLESAGPSESADEARLREVLEQVEEAELRGQGLSLNARLGDLTALDPWVRGIPELSRLPGEQIDLMGTALYEVCANIVEHGCGEDGRSGLQVWWQSDTANTTAGKVAPAGRFLIVDRGRPFRPTERRQLDFHDPAIRARGRGFGLEIIQRVASEISYHPATARGNITVLSIGLRRSGPITEEIRS